MSDQTPAQPAPETSAVPAQAAPSAPLAQQPTQPPAPHAAPAPAPGYAQPAGYIPVAVHVPSQTNGLATAALVLGIVGFIVTMIPLGIGVFVGGLINILAFVFGIIGAVKSGKLPGNLGRAAAVVGIVLSCVAFILMFFGAGWLW